MPLGVIGEYGKIIFAFSPYALKYCPFKESSLDISLEKMYWNVVFSFALVDLALVAALLVSDLCHNHFKISGL
jgi:hypothetical protein